MLAILEVPLGYMPAYRVRDLLFQIYQVNQYVRDYGCKGWGEWGYLARLLERIEGSPGEEKT